jgi:alanyl-tRNA synthetase
VVETTGRATTERLYFADSRLLEFEARVVAATEKDGRAEVELDRTAFYPTGGGQPHDVGTLTGAEGEWNVGDVVAPEDGGDRIVHVVTRDLSKIGEGAKLPEVGAVLRGKVDGARRRDHLQQHTGQHLLSQAFVQVATIETRSFHLGARTSTIDVDPRVTDEIAAKAFALANEIVLSDRPARVHLVGPDELERFRIRRQTFHGDRIRLIEIEGYDVSTCGGTHAQRTGEVGAIALRSIEKQKGLHRVEFVCGVRALREAEADRRIVQDVARTLSTGPDAVVAQVKKLAEEGAAQRKRVQQLFALAAGSQARSLLERAKPRGAARIVSATLPDLSFEELQVLARELVKPAAGAAPVVALLGLDDPAAPKLLFTRGADASLAGVDCGALVKQVAARFGGRGGGSATTAQAAIAKASDLPEALAVALETLPG